MLKLRMLEEVKIRIAGLNTLMKLRKIMPYICSLNLLQKFKNLLLSYLSKIWQNQKAPEWVSSKVEISIWNKWWRTSLPSSCQLKLTEVEMPVLQVSCLHTMNTSNSWLEGQARKLWCRMTPRTKRSTTGRSHIREAALCYLAILGIHQVVQIRIKLK